jgi:hypothetical protein
MLRYVGRNAEFGCDEGGSRRNQPHGRNIAANSIFIEADLLTKLLVPGVGLAELGYVSSPFVFTKTLIPRCSGFPRLPGCAVFNPKPAPKILARMSAQLGKTDFDCK